MARRDSARRALEAAAEIRRAARQVSDECVARRLRHAERLVRRDVGPSVPKSVAATALGVSVAALDRWIASGRLPVVRRPRGREEVEAAALLDLLEEVSRLREEEGVVRRVLAAAFARLGRRGLPRPGLRPNTPARELRRSYLASTPAERLRETAELSYAVTSLAGYGARRRALGSERAT
ncbi:MAG: hypothetical protein ACRDNG_09100 [Gaiellaceae bacterium]